VTVITHLAAWAFGLWCGGTLVGWAVRRRLAEQGYDVRRVLGMDKKP